MNIRPRMHWTQDGHRATLGHRPLPHARRKTAMSRRLDRRSVLMRGLAFLGSGLIFGAPRSVSAQSPPAPPPWMTAPGAGMSGYGTPSRFESRVTRTLIRSQPGTTGSGGSRTPLESLEGTVTPSGLHFERHHSGVPEIDPAQHRV